MNWKQEAINDLRSVETKRQSLSSIKERISALECEFQSIKCVQTDSVSIKGGSTSCVEDHMLNNIVERERLTHTYNATEKLVNLIERGFAELTDDEQAVLDKFFIHREHGHVETLIEELHLEKTSIYQIKDKAIYKFTISMYGISEY